MIAAILTVHRRFLTAICTCSVSTFRSITREPARCIAALRLTYAETPWLTPQLHTDVARGRSDLANFRADHSNIVTNSCCKIFEKKGTYINFFSLNISPNKTDNKAISSDGQLPIDRSINATRRAEKTRGNSLGIPSSLSFPAIIVCVPFSSKRDFY